MWRFNIEIPEKAGPVLVCFWAPQGYWTDPRLVVKRGKDLYCLHTDKPVFQRFWSNQCDFAWMKVPPLRHKVERWIDEDVQRALFHMRIEQLNLPTRARNCFVNARIETVGFVPANPAVRLMWPNYGTKCDDAFVEALLSAYQSLGIDKPSDYP